MRTAYDRHQDLLYKEDFNQFLKALTEAVDYVKTELMPDFDFDSYNHRHSRSEGNNQEKASILPLLPIPLRPIRLRLQAESSYGRRAR